MFLYARGNQKMFQEITEEEYKELMMKPLIEKQKKVESQIKKLKSYDSKIKDLQQERESGIGSIFNKYINCFFTVRDNKNTKRDIKSYRKKAYRLTKKAVDSEYKTVADLGLRQAYEDLMTAKKPSAKLMLKFSKLITKQIENESKQGKYNHEFTQEEQAKFNQRMLDLRLGNSNK